MHYDLERLDPMVMLDKLGGGWSISLPALAGTPAEYGLVVPARAGIQSGQAGFRRGSPPSRG
jgi:hypothetical protein